MKRYSEADKKWLIEEWEKSGKSKWAFSKDLGLNYQSLNRWTRPPVPSAGFVEVSKKLGDMAEPPLKSVSGIIVEQGSSSRRGYVQRPDVGRPGIEGSCMTLDCKIRSHLNRKSETFERRSGII